MDPFLALLLSISSRLDAKEVSDLKFLCKKEIGKSKLESIQSGHELFNSLIEKQMITSGKATFLEDLLKRIGREDLASQLHQFIEEGEVNAPEEQPDDNEKLRLRTAIRVICDNVGRGWRRPVRELGLSEVKIQRIEAASPFDLREQLLQALLEWQKWKGRDAKANDLIKALRVCHLNLAADQVELELLKLNG
ncbi:FAS-associated death domain protein [Heliangelus exortis]|uniref:FAS-associated death domain protein n=1 Tax=Heliangelus exortis TaxID=472823 RepID=UPI003A94B4EF